MKQPFKTGTPLGEIIFDGWSRDLPTEQVVEECTAMGYVIDTATVRSLLGIFQNIYKGDTDPLPKFLAEFWKS